VDVRTKSTAGESSQWGSTNPDNGNSALNNLFQQKAAGRRQLVFQRGAVLFSEEDRVDGVYHLLSGRIKLSRLTPSGKEVLLELVEPGDVFGLQDVLRMTPRTMTAAALTKSRVIRLGSKELEENLRGSPKLMRDLLQLMLRRMSWIEQRMEALMTQTVPRRLGYTLLELVRSDGDDNRGYVGLTHQDLSNLVGTSRETVSLFLARFRQSGWVATERGRIQILDPEGLEKWLEREGGADDIPTGASGSNGRRLDKGGSPG
jgi:CRP-like cAMP-binding protein